MEEKSRVFLSEFFRNWKQLGTPFESSRSLVNKVVKEITGKHVIELGAGTGSITRGILDYHKDVQVSSFEINPKLLSELYKIEDPRLRVIPESAEKISEYFPDLSGKCIVSGLPFSSMRPEVVYSILRQCRQADRFIAYKYRPMDGTIREHFEHFEKKLVYRGFPFAVVYIAFNKNR